LENLKMKLSILSRFNASLIFEYESEENSLKITLQAAVKNGADLYGADLYGADLYGASLYGADLRGADLRGADLRGADLDGADLRGADLYGAHLRGADLDGASLYGADLDGEKLTKTPLQLNNLKWFVLISDKYLRIGCQRFTIEEWKNFDDETIVKMDFAALKFWRKWKAPIIALCDAHTTAESAINEGDEA
jgi:hypothetical protein